MVAPFTARSRRKAVADQQQPLHLADAVGPCGEAGELQTSRDFRPAFDSRAM